MACRRGPQVMQRLGLPAETSAGQAIPLAALGIEIGSAARNDYDNSHVMRVPLQTDGTGGFYLHSCVPVGTRLFLMQRDEERSSLVSRRRCAGWRPRSTAARSSPFSMPIASRADGNRLTGCRRTKSSPSCRNR